MKQVIVHIDSLRLRGFRHEDQYDISTGLWEELTRLFSDPMVVHQMTDKGNVSQLRVDNLYINKAAIPRRVGVVAARGIGKEITK